MKRVFELIGLCGTLVVVACSGAATSELSNSGGPKNGSANRAPAALPPAAPEVPDKGSLHEVTYPAAQEVGVKAWLASHGLGGSPPPGDCWDLHDAVGVPPAPGLLCETWDLREERRTASVLRLEGKVLRSVFATPIKTPKGWLDLTVILASGGATLSVLESSRRDCMCALREYEKRAHAGYPAKFGGALFDGCRARGEYTWNGDRYEGPKVTPASAACPREEEIRP